MQSILTAEMMFLQQNGVSCPSTSLDPTLGRGPGVAVEGDNLEPEDLLLSSNELIRRSFG